MAAVDSSVQCGDCATYFPDEMAWDKERRPCPECGSVRRLINIQVSDEIKVYEQFRVKQKEEGTSGFVLDQTDGDDYTKSSGRYNKKVRIIDRKNDKYYECVTNSETGEVMHLRDEKLSEHYGRGTAKFQPHHFPQNHVAEAAYFIWEKTNRLDGQSLKHWDMAIEDLRRSAAGVKTLYS